MKNNYLTVEIIRNTVADGRPVHVGEIVDIPTKDAELLYRLGKAIPHIEAKSNKLDTPTTDEDVEVNTVGELAKVLGKNVAETVAFLAENYQFEAKNGKAEIPDDIFNALVADGVIVKPGTGTDEDGNPAE